MKIKTLLYIVFFSLSISSDAQETQTEYEISNKKLIKEIKANTYKDTVLINKLIEVGHYYLGDPSDSAKVYLNSALKLSIKLKDSFNTMRVYNRFALRQIYMEEDEKALKYADSALRYANTTKKTHLAGIGYSHRIKGIAYNFLERNDLSLEQFLEANRFLLKDDQDEETKSYLAENYGDLAAIYLSIENKETAIACIEKAIAIAKPINAYWELGDAYNFLAGYYYDEKEYEISLKYLDSAAIKYKEAENFSGISNLTKNRAEIFLEQQKYDAALEIYNTVLIEDKEEDIPYTLTNDYIFFSKIYTEKDNLLIAKQYLDSAKIQAKISANPIHIFTIASQQARIFKAENNYTSAINELQSVINSQSIEDFIETKKDLYKQLYETYEDANKPKEAFMYLKIHEKLEDSLRSILQKNKFNVIQSEFNYNELASKLEARDAELKLSEAEKKRANDRIYFIIFGVLLLTGFFIYAFIRQKKLEEIKRENLEAKQEVLSIKKEALDKEMEYKNKQITDFAIHISEKNELLENIKKKLKGIKTINDNHKDVVVDAIQYINSDIDQNKEKIEFYQQVDATNESFISKLNTNYPQLTEKEKKVATMLRLGQTSKQIARQLNISAASVDNYRYNLRKKLEIPKGESLKNFIKAI